MTDEEAALLRAVRAAPDDAPKLVYADWLEETGAAAPTARAALIRLQCRSQSPRPPAGTDWPAESAALARWLAGLPAEVARWAADAPFFHGFLPPEVRVPARLFAAYPDEFVRLVAAGRLRFDGAAGHGAALAACPALAEWDAVDLSGNLIRNADVEELARSEFLRGTRELDLRSNRFNYTAVVTVASVLTFVRLERLDLGRNAVDSSGVQAVARSANFIRLAALGLAGASVGPVGFEELSLYSDLPALRELDLSDNQPGPRGVLALVRAPRLKGLTRLALRGVRMTTTERGQLARRFGAGVCEF